MKHFETNKTKGKNMKKKLVAVLLASTMALSLSACGGSDSSNNSSKSETTQEKPTEKEEKAKAPVDLSGKWKSEDNDGSWMEAEITENTISVNWISDNGDTSSVYWVGTYEAPTEYTEEYTWTSTRDQEATDGAVLASTDDTKDFTYSDADHQLTYQVSAAGTTTKMKLTKE